MPTLASCSTPPATGLQFDRHERSTVGLAPTVRPPRAWPTASGFSVQNILDRRILQGQIRVHALELGVLGLELAQPLQLGHLYARVLALPLVVRGAANAVLAAQFGNRHTGLAFLQHRNNLAFREPAFLQGSLRLVEAPKFYRLMSTNWGSLRQLQHGTVGPAVLIHANLHLEETRGTIQYRLQ